MSAAFHYAAFEAGGRVGVTALNDNAERMLEACGFKWNRRHQRYAGEPSRLRGMELLIDAGYLPMSSFAHAYGVTLDDMDSGVLDYADAVREVRRARPCRCPRTLDMFL